MARTKSEKLKAKRGRPRLPAMEREPNGRRSRRTVAARLRQYESEQENMNIAVNRRIRHLGLVDTKIETAMEQAKDPRRGYALGLLLIDKKITLRQHDAGVKLAEDMARYYGLTGIQFPSARAQDLFAIKSDGEVSESRALAAKAASFRTNKLRDVLLSAGDINTGRKVLQTVLNVAVLDIQESRGWPEHMMLLLRKGLNKLGDYYQMPA